MVFDDAGKNDYYYYYYDDQNKIKYAKMETETKTQAVPGENDQHVTISSMYRSISVLRIIFYFYFMTYLSHII